MKVLEKLCFSLNTDMQKNNEIVIILILGIKNRKKLKLISFCDTVCIDIKNTLLLGKAMSTNERLLTYGREREGGAQAEALPVFIPFYPDLSCHCLFPVLDSPFLRVSFCLALSISLSLSLFSLSISIILFI